MFVNCKSQKSWNGRGDIDLAIGSNRCARDGLGRVDSQLACGKWFVGKDD